MSREVTSRNPERAKRVEWIKSVMGNKDKKKAACAAPGVRTDLGFLQMYE